MTPGPAPSPKQSVFLGRKSLQMSKAESINEEMMHELNVKLLDSVCIEITTLLRRQLYWLQIIFRRESRILIAEEHIGYMPIQLIHAIWNYLG